MKRSNRAVLALALGLALAASVGCSGHNLALVGRGTLSARASQPVQSQIVRTDVVAMQMVKDASGNPHTHMIRLQQSASDWDQHNN